MKKLLLTLTIILAATAATAQTSKFKKERHNGTYSTYTAIILNGKEIKSPTRLQAIQCMIEYLNNNWLESSNVYRAKHIHTSINYSQKNNTLNNI